MKIIKKENTITEYYDMYQAVDGTEFRDKKECEKYEASALGVLRGRISNLIVADTRNTTEDAWTLLGGTDDNDVVGIKMPTIEDFNTVCQFFLLECPWYNNEERKKDREEKISIIEKAFRNEDIVLFGINCEGDYYLINSRQGIIDKLNNFYK